MNWCFLVGRNEQTEVSICHVPWHNIHIVDHEKQWNSCNTPGLLKASFGNSTLWIQTHGIIQSCSGPRTNLTHGVWWFWLYVVWRLEGQQMTTDDNRDSTTHDNRSNNLRWILCSESFHPVRPLLSLRTAEYIEELVESKGIEACLRVCMRGIGEAPSWCHGHIRCLKFWPKQFNCV